MTTVNRTIQWAKRNIFSPQSIIAIVISGFLTLIVYMMWAAVNVNERAVASGEEVVALIEARRTGGGEVPISMAECGFKERDGFFYYDSFKMHYATDGDSSYALTVVVDYATTCVYESRKGTWILPE